MGFRPYLQDQLVSFSALTLLVWSYGLQKIVPDMPYNVFGGTLNLAQSQSQFIRRCHCNGNDKIITRYRLMNANEKQFTTAITATSRPALISQSRLESYKRLDSVSSRNLNVSSQLVKPTSRARLRLGR